MEIKAQSLIELMVKSKANVDIAGKTHTGMTTLLRCLCASEPKDEKIICLEDSHDLSIEQGESQTR